MRSYYDILQRHIHIPVEDVPGINGKNLGRYRHNDLEHIRLPLIRVTRLLVIEFK
jgi:hypothetical protein